VGGAVLALPYITINPLDLTGVGLGRIGIFSITSALSVVMIFIAFSRFIAIGGDIKPRVARSLIAAMVVVSYLGAYWGQLFLYRPDLLMDDPLLWLKPWQGGFSSMGGFFGALVGGALYARFKGEAILPDLDRGMFAFNIGWVIARTGCAIIHDHKGVETSFLWEWSFRAVWCGTTSGCTKCSLPR